MKWLKNSVGTPDAMLTFATGGFLVTTIAILASFVNEVTIKEFNVTIGAPDATIVAAFLGATLLAYVNRRNVKDKHSQALKIAEIENRNK